MDRNDKQACDRGTSLLSPDGCICQVEYIRKAIKRGASVLGARTADGVVLAALRSAPPELMETGGIEKLHKLDDALGAAMTGHVADAWKLVDFARAIIRRKHLRYNEPIGVEALTKTVTDNIQESMQSGGTRPYGVSSPIGGVEGGSGRLSATDSSGTPREWKVITISDRREDVQAALEDDYARGLSLKDGLALAVEVLVATDEEVESDELNLVIVSGTGYEIVDEETIAELFVDATANDEPDETDEHEGQVTDGSPTDGSAPTAGTETIAATAAVADTEVGATADTVAVTFGRIVVYPAKLLGVEFVGAADIIENGGLHDDREYAIFDEGDEYVNGKRERAVLRVQSSVPLADGAVELSAPEVDDYDSSIAEADSWFSMCFDYSVELRHDPVGEFPDDIEASGPIVISTGTLSAVASRFDSVDAGEMRRRLRSNLASDVSESFWEDHLFDRCGTVVEFSVGGVVPGGVNSYQRCVIPSRGPNTGTETIDSRTTFMARRREAFPEWSSGDWFDHDFRLMINAAMPESSWGEALSVDDVVTVGNTVPE